VTEADGCPSPLRQRRRSQQKLRGGGRRNISSRSRVGIRSLHKPFREKKMIRRSRIAPLLLLPFLLAGCSSAETKLEPIAGKLQEAVNRCRADVVERGSKYEESTHCRSLGAIARQYMEAGGFTDKTSCSADRIAESARARAWMTLAVSKTGDRNLAVW
jgi:hypothetical protein